jgi:hypothetical protein
LQLFFCSQPVLSPAAVLQAGVGTNPADVLKVRLQMQNELGAAAARQAAGSAAAAQPQLGLLQMLRKILKAEGPAALYYGWQVRLHVTQLQCCHMKEPGYAATCLATCDVLAAAPKCSMILCSSMRMARVCIL